MADFKVGETVHPKSEWVYPQTVEDLRQFVKTFKEGDGFKEGCLDGFEVEIVVAGSSIRPSKISMRGNNIYLEGINDEGQEDRIEYPRFTDESELMGTLVVLREVPLLNQVKRIK